MTNFYDCTVIGAGPAGVSCAIWLKQLGFSVCIVDKNEKAGGLQIQNAYTNTWIASSFDIKGADVVEALGQNLIKFKIDSFFNTEVISVCGNFGNFETTTAKGLKINSKTVVMATGTTANTGGLTDRVGLIVGTGEKVAARNFEGKKIAILGGGDSAFENYKFVKEKRPSSLKIFARTLRARAALLEHASPDDVFEGSYTYDEKTNSINGEIFDEVIVCYGFTVNEKALLGLSLALKKGGFVQTDANCQTSIEGIYAIGEITNNLHPCCVTSMAEGVIASKAIQRSLEQSLQAEFKGKLKRFVNLTKTFLKN